MAVISALVFTLALALVCGVIASTLIPSWGRILDVLMGKPTPQPRLVLARHHRVIRLDRRAMRLAERPREAA